jgi:hypothetical protein
MEVQIKDICCPVCGATEHGPDGKLQVRGFKVHRNGMWWSNCIAGADHGKLLLLFQDGKETEITLPSNLWFTVKDTGEVVLEVSGTDYVVEFE